MQEEDLINTSGADLLNYAIEKHKPSHVFALFSGGHDSLCATHAAMATGKVDAVVHCNTGIGVEKTREFVREVCKQYNWPLIEIRAKEDCGQDYEELVLEQGFPGPPHHNKMYNKLKERCIEWLEKKYRVYGRSKNNRIKAIPIILVTGCRSVESTRRMGTVKPIGDGKGGRGYRIWVAIHHNYSNTKQGEYMEEHNLPRNPVKDAMCMSGECLCGAFAHPGELSEWQYFFPEDPGIIELMKIREKVMKKFPWDWDERPPKKKKEPKIKDSSEEQLCTRCHLKQEIIEDYEKKEK